MNDSNDEVEKKNQEEVNLNFRKRTFSLNIDKYDIQNQLKTQNIETKKMILKPNLNLPPKKTKTILEPNNL